MEPGALPTERTRHAFKEICGTQIDVLVELPPHWQQQVVNRHLVRHVGAANRAEENGVVLCQCVPAVRRHDAAMLLVVGR